MLRQTMNIRALALVVSCYFVENLINAIHTEVEY